MAHLDGGVCDVDDGTVVNRVCGTRREFERILKDGRDSSQEPFVDSKRSSAVGHNNNIPILEP